MKGRKSAGQGQSVEDGSGGLHARRQHPSEKLERRLGHARRQHPLKKLERRLGHAGRQHPSKKLERRLGHADEKEGLGKTTQGVTEKQGKRAYATERENTTSYFINQSKSRFIVCEVGLRCRVTP